MNADSGKEIMQEADEWLCYLASRGRKENTLRTHRQNVKNCLRTLAADGRPTLAREISVEDVQYLWKVMPVKETVRNAYLRSLSNMVCYHTGVDIVKKAAILRNRETFDRVFITKDQFVVAYKNADPMQRLILCLGAYMGLRRVEMNNIRDGDIEGGVLTIHGKGHGEDGLVTKVTIPQPVMAAIEDFRRSPMMDGIRVDDYLLQSQGAVKHPVTTLHKMAPNKITMQMTMLGKKLGFKITTHSLRRFYATMIYYETGSDIQTLRNLMRHASVNTTLKCYVDASEKNEREAKDKLTCLINGLLQDA